MEGLELIKRFPSLHEQVEGGLLANVDFNQVV